MSEEEISLSGSSLPSKKQTEKRTAAAESVESDLKLEPTVVPNLVGLVGPGASDADLLDAVIQTPEEQLNPYETVMLPSKGLYYGWESGYVRCRPMGQVADKIFATQRLAQTGQAIDYLLNEYCILPNGMQPIDLLLGDRTFLLYYLRGITYGNLYEFIFKCPNQDCCATSTHKYDLNNLAKTITGANEALGREPFKVVLPHLTKTLGRPFWVQLRFLRGSDSEDILRRQKVKSNAVRPGMVRNRARGQQQQQVSGQITLDESITENLEKVVVSAMGDPDTFKIRTLLSKMHQEDISTIREWLVENTPGIDTTVQVTCPHCSRESTVGLPITEGFFRKAK